MGRRLSVRPDQLSVPRTCRLVDRRRGCRHAVNAHELPGLDRRGERTMHQDTLTYQADGLTMRSRLIFEPASGPRAGVLVFPEAFGLDAHAIRRAERLAALG